MQDFCRLRNSDTDTQRRIRHRTNIDYSVIVLGVRRDNCDSPGKKSQDPVTFRSYFRRDSLYGHLYRIEYPDAFYEGRCVVHTDHESSFIG